MIRLAGQEPARAAYASAKELRRIRAEGQAARLEDQAKEMRRRLDDLIEKLITLADEFDGDSDNEETGDLEPYTGESTTFTGWGDDLEDGESPQQFA